MPYNPSTDNGWITQQNQPYPQRKKVVGNTQQTIFWGDLQAPGIRDTQDALIFEFTTTSLVRDTQDVIIFEILANTPFSVPVTFQIDSGPAPKIKRNHGLYQAASNSVFPTKPKVFPIIFCVT